MKKLATIVIFIAVGLIGIFFAPMAAYAQTSQWDWPIQGGPARVSINPFGILHDANYYKGKEQYFPNTKWSGYHSGTDFETTADEKNKDVPIYAITDGTISFVGSVSGYGGVILEKLSDGQRTALYGHVRLANTTVKTGQEVQGGQFLTNLGTGFSTETSGERKHLHLGIYNGTGLYFHGYEQSQSALDSKWVDPIQFLQQHNAKEPRPTTSVAPTSNALVIQSTTQPTMQPTLPQSENFFIKLRNLFVRLLRRL